MRELISDNPIEVRLARSQDEIEAAQRLRYQVFYEEHNAQPTQEMVKTKRDMDEFDALADHLVVVDRQISEPSKRIVGTYRLLRRSAADAYGRFYSSDEFDLNGLLGTDLSLLELGRSCVEKHYRTQHVMRLLWEGIADYVVEHGIELMFGCASFEGVNIDDHAIALSYLYHYHLCNETFCPKALQGRHVNMNRLPKDELGNVKRVFAGLPPLIKGYLRLGATIGDGAVIDEPFDTTDVCIVVQTHLLTSRYRQHYERKMQKPMPGHIGVDTQSHNSEKAS